MLLLLSRYTDRNVATVILSIYLFIYCRVWEWWGSKYRESICSLVCSRAVLKTWNSITSRNLQLGSVTRQCPF